MFHYYIFIGILISTGAASSDSSRPKATGRIVGGGPADIRELKYQISIQKFGYRHHCGGSIITPRTIVTAAHCVPTGDPTDLSIRAGTADYWVGGQMVNITSILVHPYYEEQNSHRTDVALVFLENDLIFNDVVGPISLCNELPKVGSVATISGWGLLSENGVPTKQLQQTQVSVVDSESCNTVMNNRITAEMICATAPGKDICSGDSGGPMTINSCLAGIPSWSVGCGRVGYPGVYTNVAVLADWIKRNLK